MKRKGFIRTLEAIMASLLFLGVIITVVPSNISQPEDRRLVQQAVHRSLEALDKSGELRDNLSVEEIENDIEPYVPVAYNHSVQIQETTNRSREASPGDSFYFNGSGYTEIQFWVKSSGITANYRGNDILSSAEEGYYRKPVKQEGWLNFSGSGRAFFDYDSYVTEGEDVSRENLRTVSYVIGDEEKEIQVKLWR